MKKSEPNPKPIPSVSLSRSDRNARRVKKSVNQLRPLEETELEINKLELELVRR